MFVQPLSLQTASTIGQSGTPDIYSFEFWRKLKTAESQLQPLLPETISIINSSGKRVDINTEDFYNGKKNRGLLPQGQSTFTGDTADNMPESKYNLLFWFSIGFCVVNFQNLRGKFSELLLSNCHNILHEPMNPVIRNLKIEFSKFLKMQVL